MEGRKERREKGNSSFRGTPTKTLAEWLVLATVRLIHLGKS